MCTWRYSKFSMMETDKALWFHQWYLWNIFDHKLTSVIWNNIWNAWLHGCLVDQNQRKLLGKLILDFWVLCHSHRWKSKYLRIKCIRWVCCSHNLWIELLLQVLAWCSRKKPSRGSWGYGILRGIKEMACWIYTV